MRDLEKDRYVLNIWFNRTYSTNVHTIGLLRNNPSGEAVRIYGTHADLDSPVISACDVAETEPGAEVSGEEYVAWALDFCGRHDIDVFIPRLHLDLISAARDRFAGAGVAVVAGPADASALLEDKAAAYRDAHQASLPVPPFQVVRDGDELRKAFVELTEQTSGGTVCMKPVTGVGGEGFRILAGERPSLALLIGKLTPHAFVDDVAAAMDAELDAGRTVPDTMVLPFLVGPEVSVDCLADDDGQLLAAIPRTKVSRRRLLVDDPAAVAVAAAIVARHRLSSLSNTQVRYWSWPGVDDAPRPYLLETNARISGGLYQTALSGVNLPWAAVEQALGRPVNLPTPRLGRAYTTVSSVVDLAIA